jgi:hypothetical protein
MILSLRWEYTIATLNELNSCFAYFHNYCKRKISRCQLSVAVFHPIQHQLVHIGWTISKMGPIIAYKTCTQERCIGKFSSVITGKVSTNVQASNLIETVAIGNRLKRKYNANDFLLVIRPNSYSEDSYINHPNNLTSAQLWSLLKKSTFLLQIFLIVSKMFQLAKSNEP